MNPRIRWKPELHWTEHVKHCLDEAEGWLEPRVNDGTPESIADKIYRIGHAMACLQIAEDQIPDDSDAD